MTFHRFVGLLCALWILGSSNKAWARVYYHWLPNPDAAFYRVETVYDDAVEPVTADVVVTHIALDRLPASLVVHAYSASGRLLGTLEAKRGRLPPATWTPPSDAPKDSPSSSATPPVPAPAPQSSSPGMVLKPPGTAAPAARSPDSNAPTANTLAPGTPAALSTPLPGRDPNPTIPDKLTEESRPADPAHEPPPETATHLAPKVGAIPTSREVAIAGLAGRETLEAHGPLSSLTGASNFAGGGIRAAWLPPTRHWHISAELSLHDFVTAGRSTAPTQGTEKAVNSQRYLRLRAALAGYADLDDFTGTGWRLGLGGGVAYARLPLLTLSSAAASNDQLIEQNAVGLLLAAALRYALRPKQDLLLDFQAVPWSPTATRLQSAQLSGAWQYSFSPTLAGFIGATYSQEQARLAVTCANQTVCNGTSRTTANVGSGDAGLALRF